VNKSANASENTICGVGEGTLLDSRSERRILFDQLTSWTIAPKEDIVAVEMHILLKVIRLDISISSFFIQ